MKVLVVDDDLDFRELAQVLIRRSYPRAHVEGYDPQSRGLPAQDFAWADYDLVLLDYELDSEQTGLDWLRRYGDLPGFPAVIFVTGADDDNLAARAIKFGADEYLSKRDTNAGHLGELISSVLADRSANAVASGSNSAAPALVSSVFAFNASETVVPDYEFRRLLGFGGSADVYLANRKRDGLTVVLKILREAMSHNERAIERLRREGQMLQNMNSVHVVKAYEHGELNGRCYLVMEYLGHGDLDAKIVEGLSARRACIYAREIALGLAEIHSQGIVHRDLKPTNIMFRYDDSLALTDFGLARRRNVKDAITSQEGIVGTPYYMSPEQCDGARADERSDIYALGVILYEMLTGERPFEADSASMMFMQHLNAPVPELPWDLSIYQALIDRLMAKDPAQRFATALEVEQVLQTMPVID